MSKEKHSSIMKHLFLGNDFDVDLGGLDFKSLGFSLSDINIEENDSNKSKLHSEHNNDDPALDEPLSELSDNNKDQFIKGRKEEDNQKSESISKIKSPIQINKKERLAKTKDNNNTNSQPINTITNNKFNVEINNSVRNNITKLKNNDTKYSHQNKDNNTPNDLTKNELNKEKDMNLELVCVHNGEKIYKLSDLFIPLNESVIRRVEKYISKTMNNTEKENKIETTGDVSAKKDVNETLELKQMIKKSKRNQRFQKLNFTYNEKYFDKTCFNENININNSLGDSLFKSKENDDFETSKSNSFLNMKKENFVLNPINCDDNHNERNRVIENNLLNSLFFIKMKLLEKKNTVKSKTFIEEIEGREDIITEKRQQCSGLFNYNDDSYDNFFELDEIENFNETFLIKGKRENQEASLSKLNNSNLEYIDIINNKNDVDVKESSILQKNLEGKV
jgi:hypothetical protein